MVAPYPDTTEKKLKEDVKKDDRRLLTLNEYIAASLDNKLFTGHYLDEYRPNEFSTRVRLASRNDGRIVNAYFNRDGDLIVHWALLADYHYPRLGGRSSGVNKA